MEIPKSSQDNFRLHDRRISEKVRHNRWETSSWSSDENKYEGQGQNLRLNPGGMTECFTNIDRPIATTKCAVGIAGSGMGELGSMGEKSSGLAYFGLGVFGVEPQAPYSSKLLPVPNT
jgi:hypothetical protein